MGLFGRGEERPVVRGRAHVVPTTAHNLGGAHEDNVNNLTAKSAAKSSVLLVAVSAEDGGRVPSESQRIVCRLPNWLRHVLYDAGSNDGEWADLPADLRVPVLIDAADRTIVALDVDATAAELEPYRAVGTRAFKETDAVLAPVRAAIKLPGLALREGRDFVSTWRKALGRRDGDDKPLDPRELEQRRRTAAMLRVRLERNPKEHEKVRRSALAAGPQMAEGVRAGVYPSHDFEAWVVFQETSGAISADEAAAYRATAFSRSDRTTG